MTKTLPAIKKEYNNNSLVYKDGSNNTLTKAQVNEIRAEYKNFIMYEDMITHCKECFSRQELGLIKGNNIMKGFKLNPQKVRR